jgi:hypothetical protein
MSDTLATAVSGGLRGYEPSGMAPPNASWASSGRPADESGMVAPNYLEKVIERLEEVVEAETAALRSRTRVDLNDFNHRKSHGLLELSRALRQHSGAVLDETIRIRLNRLKARLETNRAVLKLHVDAVREISSIVADTIRNAESDGTYSPAVRGSQKRP